MSLQLGAMFGNYKIGECIGEGGMGQVFLATDNTLDRQVAIKVLPESFAQDADRVSRFDREARTLASLNHPNIAQIYGLEKQGDTTAIIMELVEGPTLADRIAHGPIPPDEALRIAKQIINGLEAAHDKGLVHRDLKPANIKVKEDGSVKILDFGIAKPMEVQGSSGSQTPTLITPAVTETGIIMGTAAYMSPEQARGRFVDERTDIWAFGCVLFEMLTGQPAFGGEDVAETMARIITLEADTGSLTGVINPAVEKTIRLCLQKDLKKRIADIRDVRLALQGEFDTWSIGDGLAGDMPVLPLWRRVAPIGVGVLLTALIMAGGFIYTSPQPGPLPINRFSYALPDELGFRNTGRNVLAVSPDGRHFAFNTTQGIYLREMGELDAHLIPGTETNLANPFFSPDGQSIAYFSVSGGQLERISIRGGAPVVIASDIYILNGASWAPGDVILFGQSDGIYRVSANGGTPELVIEKTAGDLFSPELLPGGGAILYSRGPTPGTVLVRSLSSGEDKVLVEGGHDAHYLPTGHLVYALGDGSLFAVVFELDTLTVSGGPVPLVQGVLHARLTTSVNYAVTRDGSLVYLEGNAASENLTLAWIDRQGIVEAIPIEPGVYAYPRISPEGDRVALDHRGDADDIWVWDFEAETRRRMTFGDALASYPVWSPDENDMVFSDASTGSIARKAANNTGQSEELLAYSDLGRSDTVNENASPSPYFITPSGEQLVFRDQANPETEDDIGMFTIGENADIEWLLREPYNERNAELSPDGRWMAYQSDESGRYEIYVRPFPNVNDDQVQVSNAGGQKPLWSRDGRELFYLEPTGSGALLMAVTVTPDENRFRFTGRQKLLDWPQKYAGLANEGRTYDVSVDGQRFLAITSVEEEGEEAAPAEFIVVQNWIEELKRLAPTE